MLILTLDATLLKGTLPVATLPAAVALTTGSATFAGVLSANFSAVNGIINTLTASNLNVGAAAGVGMAFQLADSSGSTVGTPLGLIQIQKTGNWTVGTAATQNSIMTFSYPDVGTTREAMRFVAGGRILMGTTADDATTRLQVNGGATFTSTVQTTGTLVANLLQVTGNALYASGGGTLQFLTGGGTPQNMISKSLVLSDVLADSANALLNGLYVKGAITTLGALTAASVTTAGALSAGSFTLPGFTFNNGQLSQVVANSQSALILSNSSTAASTTTGLAINLYDTASVSIIAGAMTALKVGAFTNGTPASFVSALTFSTVNGSNASAERMRINGGNLLVGTTVDDGVNRLQIAGSTKITGALFTTGLLTAGSGAVALTNAAGNLLASTLTGTVPNAVVLPTASTTQLGAVMVDGTTVTITNGIISAVASGGGTSSGSADGMTLMGGI